MKAIDMMIVMGSKMDGNPLRAAVEAHYKASNCVDAKGVTPAAGYEAVHTANGRTDAPTAYGTIPTNKSPTIRSRPGPKSWTGERRYSGSNLGSPLLSTTTLTFPREVRVVAGANSAAGAPLRRCEAVGPPDLFSATSL
jgi:hypothetical protein